MSTAGLILIENIKLVPQLNIHSGSKDTEIVQAQLGNDAGITGAAGLIKTYILEKGGVK